jgi:TonB family protein
MRRLLIINAVLLSVLAAAPAAGAQDRGPDWVRKPRAEDLVAAWPRAAWERGEGGKATIACTVTVQGSLRDCKVASETPPGSGFGAAALALAPQFQMRPRLKDGQPEISSVRIPINFEAPGKVTGSLLRGPEGTTRRMVLSVPWQEAPSVADVQAAYPPRAKAEKVTGHVALQCGFAAEGRIAGCQTSTEEPSGYGFASAARALTSKFRGPLADSQGAPLRGARVTLKFIFAKESLEGDAAVVGKPNWTSLPKGEDFTAAFPAEARKAGVLKARVVLACTVAPDGALSGCQPRSEDPPGYGFGAATVALARNFKLGVWSEEGLPTVGGTVSVPIRYDMTEPPADTAAKR